VAGKRAGQARRRGDEPLAVELGIWLERALELEANLEKYACRQAYNQGYSICSPPFVPANGTGTLV